MTPSAVTPEDHLALSVLSQQYATAVDRRDRTSFLDVFHPDAVLRIFNPAESDQPTAELAGLEQLGEVTTRIARFDRTFHFVGAGLYDVAVDTASGEVPCIAHHLTRGDDTTDYVMYIRYVDEYLRDDAHGWRISTRTLFVEWTDTRPVADGS
jgi:hypothetical protein